MGLRFWGTWHMVPSMHTHPLLRTHMQDFLCSPHKSSQVLSGVYMSGEWHPCHLLNVACNSLGFLCHVRWQLSTVLCWEIGSPVRGLFRRPGPEGRHEVNGVFPQGEVAPGPALFCFFCKVRGFVPPLTSHHDQFKAVGSTSWEQQPGKVWDKNKPPSLKLIVSDGGSLVISCRQRHQGAGTSERKPWAPSVKRLDFSREFGVCIWSCSTYSNYPLSQNWNLNHYPPQKRTLFSHEASVTCIHFYLTLINQNATFSFSYTLHNLHKMSDALKCHCIHLHLKSNP